MEVHAHSHAHGKKNWKSYFWEFLMLFLAVFCGFLAENQREHFIEHQREKQYAKQLLSDLRKDSAYFITKQERLRKAFSGQQDFKRKIIQQQATDTDILRGFLAVYKLFDARLTNTTFSQMKTSGALRYIRNRDLTTELTNYYDVTTEHIKLNATVAKDFLQDRLATWFLKHVRTQDLDEWQDSIITSQPIVIDRSERVDQELLNITEAYRSVNFGIREFVDNPAARQVELLIEMIKKEYHLSERTPLDK